MTGKFTDTLHEIMTNQWFIVLMAVLIFLLAITLADSGPSQAVAGVFWT
jgi:hypothetical protein